ncbi:hypothetical protein A2U01_0017295 [Trifolium medium]|uniref:Uncharacterized protein n=1 Tax=Trifolium medium TaxID=97028 RepID=A0A392NA27_9FABA|nr:hypothetical protein [Trifolium medium]
MPPIFRRLPLQLENPKEKRESRLELEVFTNHLEGSDKGQRVRVKIGRGQIQPTKYTDGKDTKRHAKLQVLKNELVHAKPVLEECRTDTLLLKRAVDLPIGRLPVSVLDNRVHPTSRRRNLRGYSSRLWPDPGQLGLRNRVDQTIILRQFYRRFCHVKPEKQRRESEFDNQLNPPFHRKSSERA